MHANFQALFSILTQNIKMNGWLLLPCHIQFIQDMTHFANLYWTEIQFSVICIKKCKIKLYQFKWFCLWNNLKIYSICILNQYWKHKCLHFNLILFFFAGRLLICRLLIVIIQNLSFLHRNCLSVTSINAFSFLLLSGTGCFLFHCWKKEKPTHEWGTINIYAVGMVCFRVPKDYILKT